MSKSMSKNLRGFAPNSKADERYRHKAWAKKQEASRRERVKAQNAADNNTRQIMKMPMYGW